MKYSLSMDNTPEPIEIFIEKKKDKLRKSLIRYLKAIELHDKQKALRCCIKPKDISREGRSFFLIEDIEIFAQNNLIEKAFVIERLRRITTEGSLLYPKASKKGHIEFRISYFIVTRNKNWGFGQYCPFIPLNDCPEIRRVLRKMEMRAKQGKSSLINNRFPLPSIFSL